MISLLMTEKASGWGTQLAIERHQVWSPLGALAFSAISIGIVQKSNFIVFKIKNIRVHKIPGLTNSVTPFCVGNA